MKVAVIFVLLFATVLCRPARKVSLSSSESSEEVVRRPAAQAIRKQALVAPQARVAPVQNVVAAASVSSDESTDSSDEDQAVAEATLEVKSDSSVTTSSATASVNSEDSEDSDDDDDDVDDDDETEESETEEEEDESSDSSESGESSTAVPSTLVPVIVTEEPIPETTEAPISPTIVTDEETARGDSLGGYPSDYKTIYYVEEKSYHKAPAPYKSYEYANSGKKMAYDMTDGNEVEKSLQVHKAIHVHSDLLEEDTSTPEVESQGLDVSSGTSQDQEVSARQASLPEEDSTSASDATTSESESSSTSAPEEEQEEEESTSSASDSTSTSEESEDEESESSEEATATPGAADSDSDESESSESDSDEEGAEPNLTTDVPVVITAK